MDPLITSQDHVPGFCLPRQDIRSRDYFALRTRAHDLADELKAKLNSEGAIEAWCGDVFLRYGPQGTAVVGAVHR